MKPITYDSLYNIVYIEEVKVSSSGTHAAFVRLSIDRSANEYVRAIWLQDLSTAERRAVPFTAGRKDSSPRFTEDSTRLGFLSNRNGEGQAQVHVISLAGGEAQRLTSHPSGVNSFEWSPDGRRIAFNASVRVDERIQEDEKRRVPNEEPEAQDPWDKKREKDQHEHEDALRFDPRTVREFPYRTGTTFVNDRWNHVYVTDVPETFSDGNKAQAARLTDDNLNYGQPAWTRDEQALICSKSRRPSNQNEMIEFWDDLVRIGLNADSRATTVLLSNQYSYTHPRISPNGRWVAFERHLEDLPEFRNTTLAILPVEGGAVTDLTAHLDRELGYFTWGQDSAWLYFTLIKDGSENLYRVSIDGGQVEQLTDGAQEVTSFDVDAQGRVIYAASTMQDPSALYLRDVDGHVVTLYKPNEKFLSEHEVRPVEEIRYPSDGFQIQGWVMTPPDFDPARKYPLALEIHGGPSAMWSPGTRSMWQEWQALASAGYVVFFCNPRGSGGYGEKFLIANRGDWGDGPMNDILRGVEQVVSHGYVDTARMVMTGGSYGGYLTAWIVGRDHRFKAAVAQRGVYNMISMRGVTDIPWFNDREAGASPWEDVGKLWAMSPISLAPQVQTPLLLEHSEQDYRVPISQAEELYLALRSFKKTVELIRWPREGHELSRSGEPKHRAERVQRILEWFGQYAGDNANSGAQKGEPMGA